MFRLMTALAGIALCVAVSAEAQTTTYRVLDLGKISDTNNAQLRTMQFWNNHLVTLPYRINSTGQVAFYRSQGTPGQQNLTFTPLLWLAEEDTSIGLSAGLYDLTASDGSDDNGIALDINERTEVAGARGADKDAERAIVWTIANSTVTGNLIDFTGSGLEPDMTHRAHALNDDDPPRVVGTATVQREVPE